MKRFLSTRMSQFLLVALTVLLSTSALAYDVYDIVVDSNDSKVVDVFNQLCNRGEIDKLNETLIS